MGPGWWCDGCGDYRMHDGKESYSVEQRRLRVENDRLRTELQRIADLYANTKLADDIRSVSNTVESK